MPKGKEGYFVAGRFCCFTSCSQKQRGQSLKRDKLEGERVKGMIKRKREMVFNDLGG